MKIKATYLIGIVLFIALFVAVYYAVSITGFFVNPIPSGKYDDFAKCLTEKGAAMYGAYWCGACKNQKTMFGDSFKYVNYIECDPVGTNAKPELCNQKNIISYPTWIIDGKYYEGVQSLQALSSLTGCPLPQ